jgi:hypothetical protein
VTYLQQEDKMNTDARHTPGPWTTNKTPSPSGAIYIYAKGRAISDADNMADAHLIAAAPDLLLELKWIAGRIDRTSGSPNFTAEEHDRVLAAIAKAEGKV